MIEFYTDDLIALGFTPDIFDEDGPFEVEHGAMALNLYARGLQHPNPAVSSFIELELEKFLNTYPQLRLAKGSA